MLRRSVEPAVNLGQGLVRMRVHYGFSQPPNIPVALKLVEHIGMRIDTESVIYILGRETLIARRDVPGLPYWQELIFVWLARTKLSGRSTNSGAEVRRDS